MRGSRKVPRAGGSVKKLTNYETKQTKQSGHTTTKCQLTNGQARHKGQGLIKLFPKNINHH